ncbi:MAG: L-aspartate oxidase [Planctomycetota bacterium]|jgi:L-aspartate oxidase|nr:L-aspartate oxidase [Planctomycetota bacterium]
MSASLLALDPGKLPELRGNVLVVGSGIAGLTAALTAADRGARVILVAKSALSESATFYAQGGIAAALMSGDSPEKHLADTLEVGLGLCDPVAVAVLVNEGRAAVQELIDRGIRFDRRDGDLHFTMEGAHCHRRILHGNGDATGRLLEEFLLARLQEHPQIAVYENHFVVDLLVLDNQCFGAVMLDGNYGRLLALRADATILATGGGGQVYRETTNPAVATGDGYALAHRAGARLRDMEMTQFHPTTLYLAGAPRFLISESVRGEGAILVNQDGEPFMQKYDARGDLAPRDVVSQAIMKEINAAAGAQVFLDLRRLSPALIRERFPNISQICASYGLDIAGKPIPVRPAAHYFMGGVVTDLDGLTTVERLFAAGETASTGVHGANRLASNSLLEGLVFGKRAAERALNYAPARWRRILLTRPERHGGAPLDLSDLRHSLQSLTWRHLGVFRSEPRLREAEQTLAQWKRYVFAEEFQSRAGWELQNMLTVAQLLTASALQRRESRGAHQRFDFPDAAPTARHTEI